MKLVNAQGEVVKTDSEGIRIGANVDFVDDGETNVVTIKNTVSTVVVETDGTTAVSVFGASGLAYPITIVDVKIVSLDTTAGNITVENPAETVVCTIAKGETAGVVVGATTLADTVVAAGTDLIVDSSSAGNARVSITYTA